MKNRLHVKKYSALLAALVLLLLFCTGCGGDSAPAAKPAETEGRIITDTAGREVSVPEKVDSIVCVGVGALRYTCYMDAAELVVGVEDYEIKPGAVRLYNRANYEHFKDLPVIGTNGEPYAEEIIALSPDVIVMSIYAAADADELYDKTGIPVVLVPGSDTVLDQGCFDTIAIMGELYGKQDRATELTDYLHGLEQDFYERTKDIPDDKRPTVYVCGLSYKGLHGFEGTEGGYGPLALLGADNLADSTGIVGAFDIDTEQVLGWDPDYIFVDYQGLPLIKEDYAQNPDFYGALSAVQNGRVYAQISFRDFASNLDTALADAYFIGTVIYPEEFGDIDPAQKAGEIYEMLLGEDFYPMLKESGYEFGQITLG